MKRLLTLALVATGVTAAAFAGSSGVVLTAPKIVSMSVGGIPLGQGDIDSLNSAVGAKFNDIQTQLNNDYFSKYHDQTEAARGFSDANVSTFDNVTLNSFQNYDLISVMIGANGGATGISPNPFTIGSEATSTLQNIRDKGDAFGGVGTGGFAGQVGLNVGFLVPKLYLSAKFGFFPKRDINIGSDVAVSFQQGMFGIGANYRLVDKIDFIGLFAWRGLSLGSGLIYNGSSTEVSMKINDVTRSFSQSTAQGNVDLNTNVQNIKAKLSLDTRSIVIPIDVSTSAQFLWLLNFGFGAGVDVAFSGTKISAGGDSDLTVTSPNTNVSLTTQPGSAVVNASNTNGNGDIFLPRIYGSIGANVSLVKVDVPFTYYPTTQSTVLGINLGVVW